MSYTEMLGVPEKGEIQGVQVYRNSWGSAPAIWERLFQKYLSKGEKWENWMNDVDALWDLVGDSRLEEYEKICLLLTFERMIVKKEDFVKVAIALKIMAKEEKEQFPEKVNHLGTIADDLISDKMKNYMGACFIWTSVTGDVWDQPHKESDYNEDGDLLDEENHRWRYDISEDEGHWFLFDSEF